jgi:hypothetical protein
MLKKSHQIILGIFVFLFCFLKANADEQTLYIIELLPPGIQDFPKKNYTEGQNFTLDGDLHVHGRIHTTGLREQYILGRFIQTLKFLPMVYNDLIVDLRSSHYESNILTLYSQLQGIFLPGTGSVLNENQQLNTELPMEVDQEEIKNELGEAATLHFAPVFPVHTFNNGTSAANLILNPQNHCVYLHYLMKTGKEVEDELKGHKSEILKAFELEGKNVELNGKTSYYFTRILYSLTKAENKELVTQKEKELLFQEAFDFFNNTLLETKQTESNLDDPDLDKIDPQLKIINHFLFQEIQNLLKEAYANQKVGDDPKRKMSIFAIDDINAFAVLKSLGAQSSYQNIDLSAPIFIFFTKTKDEEKYQVEFKYKNKPLKTDDYENTLTFLQKQMFTSNDVWTKTCNQDTFIDKYDPTTWIIVSVVLLVIFVIMISFTCYCVNKKSSAIEYEEDRNQETNDEDQASNDEEDDREDDDKSSEDD